MKRIVLFLLLPYLFHSCEKDDICTPDTPTTPRLIIEFYDSINTSVLKEVANLQVKGEGAESVINFNLVSRIELPLKTNENQTNYQFTINSTATTSDLNTDLIQIDYIRRDIYISRACGFKTYFNLNLLDPIKNNNPEFDTIFWIEDIEIIKNSIETEEDVHVKMYF